MPLSNNPLCACSLRAAEAAAPSLPPILHSRQSPSWLRQNGVSSVCPRFVQLRKSCDCYCELVSDLPAVLRLFGDWAEECTLPMLPSVCFAAGRCTSTQSSWTALDDCSRKWMSGQADALTAAQDRRRCAEKTRPTTTLRENPSPGRPPSLLDFYLSWMSPICHPICPFATPRAMNAATATRAATKTMVSKAPRPLLSKRSDTGCPIQSKSM